MNLRTLAVAVALLTGPAVLAQQQDWPDLDALLFGTLTNSGRAEASFWLPDSADPARATRALGVVYEHIPGSAGNTTIALGYYLRSEQGWAFAGPVSGVFGQSPRDPVYTATTLEITTTTLGPDDARCCPSVESRWRIDLQSRAAQPLR